MAALARGDKIEVLQLQFIKNGLRGITIRCGSLHAGSSYLLRSFLGLCQYSCYLPVTSLDKCTFIKCHQILVRIS